MIRFAVILFLVNTALASCSKDTMAEYVPSPVIDTTIIRDTTAINDTTVVRDTTIIIDTTILLSYLALGDSYTIGQSVPEADRFPVQAVHILNRDTVKFSAPEIIAQTGWTTGNLLYRLNNKPPLKTTYDIVSLLIGVNNQYQHRTQNEYRSEFITLLNKAIVYANNNKARVFVLSIPDYSVTPFANGYDKALIAAQIDSFNIINKKEAQLAGVNYLDITGSTRMAATDPTLIAADGLHPSGKEYNKWAESLVPMIRAVLH